jgi:simple sugar transport system permease protein
MIERFLASTVAMATPILLAALGELVVEECGIINIGIEGAMLVGAFCGLVATYFTNSAALGLAAAIGSAVALNAVLAVLIVNVAVNQVVAGTALNLLALGVTGVAYRRIFGVTGQALTVAPLRRIALGPLARIPVVGPAIFDQTALVYLAIILIPVVAYGLHHTSVGLRLRSCGEHPEAADALGIDVYRTRWLTLLLAGALSGVGGAYLTLAYTSTFVEGITGGRGFVALAVVIIGRWQAWGVAAASILFGASMALQFSLQAVGTMLPYQLFLGLPYLLTLIVLAIVSGQATAPSALGQSYIRQ